MCYTLVNLNNIFFSPGLSASSRIQLITRTDLEKVKRCLPESCTKHFIGQKGGAYEENWREQADAGVRGVAAHLPAVTGNMAASTCFEEFLCAAVDDSNTSKTRHNAIIIESVVREVLCPDERTSAVGSSL